MIIASAGRRIDAQAADEPVFAYSQVDVVRARLLAFFRTQGARTLICSAACGADLLALEVAASLAMRRCVILPFDAHTFRETSVVDRPGDWGALFDRVVADAETKGDLVNLQLPVDEEAYLMANQAIVEQALSLAASSGQPAMAVLIWNGAPRAKNDVTQAFGDAAAGAGLRVAEISTLELATLREA